MYFVASNAAGGGEKVLWCLVKALLAHTQYASQLDVAIYTGEGGRGILLDIHFCDRRHWESIRDSKESVSAIQHWSIDVRRADKVRSGIRTSHVGAAALCDDAVLDDRHNYIHCEVFMGVLAGCVLRLNRLRVRLRRREEVTQLSGGVIHPLPVHQLWHAAES